MIKQVESIENCPKCGNDKTGEFGLFHEDLDGDTALIYATCPQCQHSWSFWIASNKLPKDTIAYNTMNHQWHVNQVVVVLRDYGCFKRGEYWQITSTMLNITNPQICLRHPKGRASLHPTAKRRASLYPDNDVIYPLPDEAIPWFEQYYAAIMELDMIVEAEMEHERDNQ